MQIGIDAGALSVNDDRLKVGVFRMAKNLINHLFKLDKTNYYHLYSFSRIDTSVIPQRHNYVNEIIKPTAGWFNVWLPMHINNHQPDVFIGLSQSLPRLPKKTRSIVFIHDLTFEKHPEWFHQSYQKLSENTRFAVNNADIIVAVSETTKNDIIKFYEIPHKRIEVIYEGIDPELFRRVAQPQTILSKYQIKVPYFLFVGTFKQSKNIPNIIKAFDFFVSRNKNYNLVLAGSNLWPDPEIEIILSKVKSRKLIKNVGFIPDQELIALYSRAYSFISPSFNEGFGLTFIEAAKFRLPIITTDCGSIKEILGQGALYANPHSFHSISQMMEKIQEKNTRRHIVDLASKQIGKFSWEIAAGQLFNLIHDRD